jgi:hypothetical protein
VAEANLEWSLQNSKRFAELRSCLAKGDSRRLSILLAELKEHVIALGQDLGFAYSAGCVLADGTPAPAATPGRYVPEARPGHRAPAVWLRTPSGPMSTIDLYDRVFTLLVGAESEPWLGRDSVPQSLHVSRIGHGPLAQAETDLHAAYGITPNGAVLVRPDGHVAWRAASCRDDTPTTLLEVLNTLALRAPRAAGAAA